MSASLANPVQIPNPAPPIRVAVICDFAEERWPSMDLVGNMLHASLSEEQVATTSTLVRPTMPFTGRQANKISRLFGRLVHYPHELRRIRDNFDVFHITDHSYAHLAHELPGDRTVVTCHDIDAFRCLVEPRAGRSAFFRGLTHRILTGMQRAAHVTCDTEATRQDLLAHGLMPADKLSVVHNGVHPALTAKANPNADAELSRLLGRDAHHCTELIHVGSTIPRKRIDILLNVFAQMHQRRPDLRLLRVGGDFTSQQRDLAQSLQISPYIDVLPKLSEELLAAAYRRSAVLLQTSESEGFGLPVIEAMACGTPVVATDIAPLHEVGGSAGVYCPLGDTPQFTAAVLNLLQERDANSIAWQTRLNNSLVQASNFTWSTYALRMTEIYSRILAR